MQSRDELRREQRRFYVWLGLAAAAHLAIIVSVVLFQVLYVRQHPPLKVLNVSLVSLPGEAGPAGEQEGAQGPTAPTSAPEPEAPASGPVAFKKVPEMSPVRPEPKPEPEVPEPKAAPEASPVRKVPEKVPDKKAPEPASASTKPAVSSERQNLKATLERLKKKTESAPSGTGTPSLGNTLARLRKKVASEGDGSVGSGAGSGAGSGRSGGQGSGGAFDPYKTTVARIIQNNWSFSSQMMRSASGLEVYVSLFIMPDGSVTQIRYDRKSVSEYLNSSVQRALEKSIPFPPLPGEYGSKGIRVGFMFTPEGIGQ